MDRTPYCSQTQSMAAVKVLEGVGSPQSGTFGAYGTSKAVYLITVFQYARANTTLLDMEESEWSNNLLESGVRPVVGMVLLLCLSQHQLHGTETKRPARELTEAESTTAVHPAIPGNSDPANLWPPQRPPHGPEVVPLVYAAGRSIIHVPLAPANISGAERNVHTEYQGCHEAKEKVNEERLNTLNVACSDLEAEGK
ncbi:hypothetical protein NDU88_001312 [Pleurodeles waltl]|uniref:Uncharacterized protein n=1 Tax=Pleurodeles waltl TaxID=8319 RepID=A0AAV7UUZ5_PLEWA|nr:hypothetical protein NDU88_001312 [Pleurodeles waltl]